MPTADRYSRYREDQTTVWISKSAVAVLDRERQSPSEGIAAVLDRVLNDYRKMRRASGGGAAGGGAGGAAGATRGAAKSASKGAAKGAARSAAKGGAKSASKRAARGAA